MAWWSRCRGAGEGVAGVDLRGLAVGVAAAGLDERVVGALGLVLGHYHRGPCSRMSPGHSGFFLAARVSALGSPSRAAGRCRLARDGSPGRSTLATLIAWCAGSCWCTAPHPLCANPGACPWLVLVSADGRRRGHLPDRGGDPWLTAGLRPVWFALRGIVRHRRCRLQCCRNRPVFKRDCRQVSPRRQSSTRRAAVRRAAVRRAAVRRRREVRGARADHATPGE
jgi:hypothetical protein